VEPAESFEHRDGELVDVVIDRLSTRRLLLIGGSGAWS
jgi:hypothetical protein